MAANTVLKFTPSRAPDHDDYWRLNDYQSTQRTTLLRDLERKGFTFRADIRKIELVEMQKRLDCGLLYYEDKRITKAELNRFIENRQLLKPVTSSRKAMISVLMGADEVLRFNKFDDLPPELRERIYQFYVSSLPSQLFNPTQPPIARACKLFREEVLPVFHSLTTFELRFYLISDDYKVGDDVRRAALRPCLQTSQFMNTLRTSGGTGARLNCLKVSIMEGSMREMQSSVGNVLVRAKYRTHHNEHTFGLCVALSKRAQDFESKLRAESRSSFFIPRFDKTAFSLDDLYKLRKDFESAFL